MNFTASEILSSAAKQIVASVGVDTVAQIAQRSVAMIYKWTDASHRYFPNLLQAFQLDAEFVRRGLGAPPFLIAYASALRHLVASRPNPSEPVSDAIKIVNHASKILVELTGHEARDGKVQPFSASNRRAMCHSLRELDQMVVALRWRIEADLLGKGTLKQLKSANSRPN